MHAPNGNRVIENGGLTNNEFLRGGCISFFNYMINTRNCTLAPSQIHPHNICSKIRKQMTYIPNITKILLKAPVFEL